MPQVATVSKRKVNREGRLDLLILSAAEVMTRKHLQVRAAPIVAAVQEQTGRAIDLFRDVVEPIVKAGMKRVGVPKRNVLLVGKTKSRRLR